MATALSDVVLPVDLAERLQRGPRLASALFLMLSTGLLVGGVLWASLAEVDRIVTATGRVEPAGKVRIVNHPTGGKVAAIHIREGQRVAAGDPLFTLDREVERAQRDELAAAYGRALVEVARLEAEIAGKPFEPEPALAERYAEVVAAQRTMYETRVSERRARREMLVRQRDSRRDELRIREAELGMLRESLVLERQQLEAVRSLAERGLYPRLKLVEMEKQVKETSGRIARAEAAVAAARSALAESESALAAFDKERETGLLDELAEATARRDRLARELGAQSSIVDDLVVRAPVAGVVENLRIRAPGQAIAANQPAVEIVPVGEELVVEAHVANDQIAEIHEGMPATLKIRAYDPTRYGTLAGTVREISADARSAEEGEPPAYRVVVAAERSFLGARPGENEVLPGMVVDVEFHAGTRTILDYLTDRLFADRPPAFSEP
jgi:HlyD family type I secretion membrane fusion protein